MNNIRRLQGRNDCPTNKLCGRVFERMGRSFRLGKITFADKRTIINAWRINRAIIEHIKQRVNND